MPQPTTSPHPSTGNEQGGIGRGLTLVLAVATGISICNMYWAQPLLATLAREFQTSAATTGLLVTASQLGYSAGLLLLVPLGDTLNRRRMVAVMLLLAAAAQAVGARAGTIEVLMAASVVSGLASVVAQVFVPWSTELARPGERGRVVGTVMSGLLLGILLARTIAGTIAGAWGWRAVYWTGAGMGVALTAALMMVLPPDPARPGDSYPRLLASVLRLVRTQPLLRLRAVYGAAAFGMFSVLWTTLSYVLAGPPYHYGDTAVGLFGLVGAAGALAANAAGRLSDRGYTRPGTGVTLALGATSFALLAVGRTSLAALLVGIIVLDVAAQATHLLNQGVIYSMGDAIRSRLNSAYMTMYFLGGALGSAAASRVYQYYGWFGACALGASIGAVAFATWCLERRLLARRGRA